MGISKHETCAKGESANCFQILVARFSNDVAFGYLTTAATKQREVFGERRGCVSRVRPADRTQRRITLDRHQAGRTEKIL